ncbi:MAG: hypothetical protein K2X43_13725 [Hyphomonadaceae bacterium]|nr:hypothetical protein [Hyphomonadaceae bacterium]
MSAVMTAAGPNLPPGARPGAYFTQSCVDRSTQNPGALLLIFLAGHHARVKRRQVFGVDRLDLFCFYYSHKCYMKYVIR